MNRDLRNHHRIQFGRERTFLVPRFGTTQATSGGIDETRGDKDPSVRGHLIFTYSDGPSRFFFESLLMSARR